MDGHLAIEHNRQALKGILAALVAMAGLGGGRATLPRRLRNAVLRLLRPAESATRRLAVALARGLVVTLPARRPRAPKPRLAIVKHGVGTGIVLPRGMTRPGAPKPPRPSALPLLDPLRQPFARRRKYVPPHRAPRISTPGMDDPKPLPPTPSPDDQLDARRLGFRLEALAAALGDLPKQALRFARWQARQRRARDRIAEASKTWKNPGPGRNAASRWPLRRGRPPGARGRMRHEVHDILGHAHELASRALNHPDTS